MAMEGDECYKFSTIRDHIRRTGAAPIGTAMDLGAHVGTIALLMAGYFPQARIVACEAVDTIFQELKSRTAREPRISPRHWAVTAEHRFLDDLGEHPTTRPLAVYRGLPGGGPGWRGGSRVAPAGASYDPAAYAPEALTAELKTLDEVVDSVLLESGAEEIDLIKFDCEGSEASAIGCASRSTLRAIRFIVGEYHNRKRFEPVVQRVLARTHGVRMQGDEELGAFFAVRRGAEERILDSWT
jgi:FkbM family methyltransferase